MFQHPKRPRNGFSLIEIVVVMTILAVLISLTAPSVVRTMEQSHADLAGASLRSIAVAQRFFWLENRTYATDLQTLIDAGLIDDDLQAATGRYQFSVTAATETTFQAQAQRMQRAADGTPQFDGAWQGVLTIDQTGMIGGTISHAGDAIDLAPAF
ncbi:MAG: prepilin-type N-terminal cleavage/methylation domain-containing protein [Planctomycetota bacterium]